MLELQHLCFEVDGKKIVNDINLTIADDRFTVITGPNGGGKSTLARLIMGIEFPTSGKILFDGVDITICALMNVQNYILDMLSSNHHVLKV